MSRNAFPDVKGDSSLIVPKALHQAVGRVRRMIASKLVKVDSIMFRVQDPEQAADFYSGVLGLKRAWTDAERGMIGFVLAESDSEIVIHDDRSIPNPSFSFLVKNVRQFCDEYRRTGGTVLAEPFEVRTGSFAVLADPDGNEIPIIDLSKFGDQPRYDRPRSGSAKRPPVDESPH